MIDLHHEYLSRQIIAYIGNKRRLLPLLEEAIASSCGSARGLTFLDLFAGSGVVSRLARLMGFRVLSNDWEEFARIINTAHVATDASEADRLFAAEGGLDGVLRRLNTLEGTPEPEYFARCFAPAAADPEEADYRRERLFYTRANALSIDRIRAEIDRLCPVSHPVSLPAGAAAPESPEALKKRALLLAPLLYEASTHANTSGVFKACHKGFGGHGKDALGRILAPIELERPVLLDSPEPATVLCQDANLLARDPGLRVDVAYLDPPYASHQYGSNYHILTTIARGDHPPAPLELDSRGRLRSKAGIRADWVKTRSAYCSRATAESSLAELVASLRSRVILVSYSSEGIIPLDHLVEICSSRGSLRLLTNEYTKYPGGKQSSTRLHRNVEVVIVVDTSRPASPAHRVAARLAVERRRTALLFARRFARRRLEEQLTLAPGGEELCVEVGGTCLRLRPRQDNTIERPDYLEGLDLEATVALGKRLEECVCRDAGEELEELLHAARGGKVEGPAIRASMLGCLRRLGHRKYREQFFRALAELRALERELPGRFGALGPGLDHLEEVVRRRLEG